MPITPDEASKKVKAQYAEQFKQSCKIIDKYLYANWLPETDELHIWPVHIGHPAIGMEVVRMLVNAYCAKGWDVEYAISARNESYLIFKAAK